MNSTELVINTDALYKGANIKGQLIGKIPVYSVTPALVEVMQFNISKKAYNYLSLTLKQGVETGGLADTPPATLIGNVQNTNKSEDNVSGYFIVAGMFKKPFWLDKKQTEGLGIPTIGLLGGRAEKLEPTGPNTTRPPAAPCVPGDNRTNIKPNGWLN
jgi:hypothetical protein